MGKTDYDIHPEEKADNYYRLEEQAFAAGKRVNQIQQVPAQDGTKHWIDNRKYPINGPDGGSSASSAWPRKSPNTSKRRKAHESENRCAKPRRLRVSAVMYLIFPKRQWTISPEVSALVGSRPEMVRRLRRCGVTSIPMTAMVAKRFKGYFLGERKPFDREYRVRRATQTERLAGSTLAAGWNWMLTVSRYPKGNNPGHH